MKTDLKNLSKFLSYVLRHKPEEINLQLDANGWASLEELLSKLRKEFPTVTFDELLKVVETNDKKRFTFNEDETKIRANQGHSIAVSLELEKTVPPEILYHGTVEKYIDSIFSDGIKKMNRTHVHLSANIETAKIVAQRRGLPIILTIRAKEMCNKGFDFFLSKNGVWLTDFVPSEFVSKLEF